MRANDRSNISPGHDLAHSFSSSRPNARSIHSIKTMIRHIFITGQRKAEKQIPSELMLRTSNEVLQEALGISANT